MSHVGHHNLTIRMFTKRFTQLTCVFSKKLDNPEAACAVYSSRWRTRFPDRSGECGRKPPPAAMVAGIASRLSSV